MLPMGTIMASCMLIGVASTASSKVTNSLPLPIRKALGAVVLAAGCWNVFWYAVQHLSEFWGQAALVSGVLMIITAMYLLAPSKLPGVLRAAKPLVWLLLLGCALLYGITIYNL